MRINEIVWNGGQGLQDLMIHGIGPTKALAEHLANMIEQPRPDDTPEARAAVLEVVIQRLDDIEQGGLDGLVGAVRNLFVQWKSAFPQERLFLDKNVILFDCLIFI